MKDHLIVSIHYSYYKVTGTWHAQDDFEVQGHSKSRTDSVWYVVASSQAVAEAHFKEHNDFHIKDPGFRMTIDKIEAHRIDRMILEL